MPQQPRLPKPEPEQVFPVPEQFNYKKPAVEFTLERRMRFLQVLRTTGAMYRAAELAGVTTSMVREWRKKEPEFAEAVDEAKQRYIDDILIKEATRRAVEGVPKPIIGGRNRDEVVATEQVYSDGLMTLLLKAARPEFRDSSKGDPSQYEQGNGGVLVLPAPPTTPEEWEARNSENANPK